MTTDAYRGTDEMRWALLWPSAYEVTAAPAPHATLRSRYYKGTGPGEPESQRTGANSRSQRTGLQLAGKGLQGEQELTPLEPLFPELQCPLPQRWQQECPAVESASSPAAAAGCEQPPPPHSMNPHNPLYDKGSAVQNS